MLSKEQVMEPHWEFIMEYEKEIRKLCSLMVRPRYDLCDEAFSRCCIRAPGIMNTYDSSKGASLKTHMLLNFRMYLWKWQRVKFAHRPKYEFGWQEIDESDSYTVNLDAPLEVNSILERLSEYDRNLLVLYHIKSMTFAEIADYMGVSKGTIRNHYMIALENARSSK